ncbi:hypothetical protein [uncultured Desulfovibrio sp.]|uniref:hypothetical protein n=1 Tax=uncultured Desulfovibrio sp. TaxID=167968 RepID=UPI00320957DD
MLELTLLLKYVLQAAELMPFILLLTYPLGRRGNGRLAIWGARRLTLLSLRLCWCSVALLLLHFGLTLWQMDDMSTLPRWHWQQTAASLLACGLAALFLALVQKANARLPEFPPLRPDETCLYDGAAIRRPMLLTVTALLCLFGLILVQGGVLAPPPQGMARGDLFRLVFGASFGIAFSHLTAAGGVALLVLYANARTPLLLGKNWDRAVRWCGIWAVLGLLPTCIDRWSDVLLQPLLFLLSGRPLGSLTEDPTALATLYTAPAAAMLTLAACLWAVPLYRPRLARHLWLLLLPWLCLLLQPHVQRAFAG